MSEPANDEQVPAAINLRDPAQFIAFGFGSGLAPKAPGTVGTLAAIPLALLLLQLDAPLYAWWTAAAFALGVWASDITCEKLGVHDHGGIVIDEFIGLFVTLLPIAFGLVGFTWITVAAGFVLFRFFDILKPWPIRVLDQRVHGGIGVMLDDLVAGIFAAGVLWLLAAVLPALFGPATIPVP
jgi:phosphatidylglycerophosphatase A